MTESIYIIPCPCGQTIQSHLPVTVCFHCGALLEVREWGQMPEVVVDGRKQ